MGVASISLVTISPPILFDRLPNLLCYGAAMFPDISSHGCDIFPQLFLPAIFFMQREQCRECTPNVAVIVLLYHCTKPTLKLFR